MELRGELSAAPERDDKENERLNPLAVPAGKADAADGGGDCSSGPCGSKRSLLGDSPGPCSQSAAEQTQPPADIDKPTSKRQRTEREQPCSSSPAAIAENPQPRWVDRGPGQGGHRDGDSCFTYLPGDPLCACAAEGKARLLAHMIQQGADVPGCRDFHGSTPLHYAVAADQPACVRVLLEQGGADVLARDAAGRTALDIAGAGGFDYILRMLREHLEQQQEEGADGEGGISQQVPASAEAAGEPAAAPGEGQAAAGEAAAALAEEVEDAPPVAEEVADGKEQHVPAVAQDEEYREPAARTADVVARGAAEEAAAAPAPSVDDTD